MLGRDTEWRQGYLLTSEAARTLGLIEESDSSGHAVVISHDCDLPNDTEKIVEVIVGRRVEALDPMLANARNPRRLQLTFASGDGEERYIELRHAGRQPVHKAEFAKIGAGYSNFVLSADEKRVLKQWLAARYGRPAFPNAFETRLRKTVRKKSVEYRIAKILEPASSHLVALFFDLGEERKVELPEGKPTFSPSWSYTTQRKGGNPPERLPTKLRESFAVYSSRRTEPPMKQQRSRLRRAAPLLTLS